MQETEYLFNQVAHAAQEQARNRIFTVPENYRSALADLFGVQPEAIDKIRITEYSDFARLHGENTLATTRVNAIYLRDSGLMFIADHNLVLHEYFHVIRQWNTGDLSVGRYVLESIRNGYWDNRYEVQARDFARDSTERFRQLLQPKKEGP